MEASKIETIFKIKKQPAQQEKGTSLISKKPSPISGDCPLKNSHKKQRSRNMIMFPTQFASSLFAPRPSVRLGS
jgi:hypothetical protein